MVVPAFFIRSLCSPRGLDGTVESDEACGWYSGHVLIYPGTAIHAETRLLVRKNLGLP